MSNASIELGGGNWAAKDGNLLGYAVGDTSGKYLPREFDFTRGGDISATRVNEDGLIEKYRENLLLHSNQFDTTWSSINTTETGGQTGYDGSSDAWLLTKSAQSARVQQSITQSGLQTFSVYAKAGTLDFLLLNNTVVSQWYDLSNGTTGTNSSLANTIDAKIEDVGNGWWRCSLTFNSSISFVRIYPSRADGDQIGTSGSIYIQDAQLEYGLVATDYLESGATTGKAGILENLPRIDYTGGSASLLLEPQRANLVPFSEYLTFEGRTTITYNHDTSPEGFKNSTRFSNTTETGAHRTHTEAFNLAEGETYTASLFAKKGTLKKISFRLLASNESSYGDDGVTGIGFNEAIFDLNDGSISGDTTGASMVDYGNGWYRCIMTDSVDEVVTDARMYVYFRADDGTKSYTGATSENMEIYGVQVEAGSYATSYIPTYGVSATRNNESTDTLHSLSSFTWFFEISRLGFSDDMTGAALTLRTSAGVEHIRCHFDAPSQQIRIRDAINGYVNIGDPISVTADTYVKVCVVGDGSAIKTFANGTQSGSSYTIVTPHDIGRVYMNEKGFNCRQLLVFPTALTDSECIALTTL